MLLPSINIVLQNKRITGLLDRVAARYDRALPAASPQDQVPAQELRRRIEAFRIPPSGADKPSEQIWKGFMERFLETVRRDDPRAFLRWPVIRKAMCVGNQPYLTLELLSLRSNPGWRQRWRPALRESPAGHPLPFWARPSSSGNLIHHAYHLAQFETRTGRPAAAFSSVFEFGGGYGSMCRLFHQSGFAGRYVIYDLPPFSALQSYYLSSLGLPLLAADQLAAAERGITCVSDPRALELALAWAGLERALFVGTGSISETPSSVREQIMPEAARCDGVLIAYWRQFGEVNNHVFFSDWAVRQPDFVWDHRGIKTLPDHFYLFGTRSRGGGLR